jgi:formate-dependent phosphoribosylglycinamide formyltransferase (GAR transformylase)
MEKPDTNHDIIMQLEGAKTALQKERIGASGDHERKLTEAINNIADEIDAIEAAALADAAYVPKTDPFKQATADGQAFLKTLNDIRTAVGIAIEAAKAADTVINIISKF